jgi:hypothetical protein
MKRYMQTKMAVAGAAAGLALNAAAPAIANDSVGHLAAGGIELGRTGDIEMREEDLYVSAKEIRVRYRFFNKSARDIETLVAFPMPEVPAPSDVENYAIPFEDAANFLGFETAADGKPRKIDIEQRAIALGIDRTALLRNLGVPLEPFSPKAQAALSALTDDAKSELEKLGLVRVESSNDAENFTKAYFPMWRLRATYHWTETFPAGREITIEHRYKPSVGASAGTIVGVPGIEADALDDYRERYCLDAGFLKAATAAHQASKAAGKLGLAEQRIGYILSTGANWAGPIKVFHLTIDKGNSEHLVSFCGEGIEKTSPTTFELKKKDYWPDKNLEVLILKPVE